MGTAIPYVAATLSAAALFVLATMRPEPLRRATDTPRAEDHVHGTATARGSSRAIVVNPSSSALAPTSAPAAVRAPLVLPAPKVPSSTPSSVAPPLVFTGPLPTDPGQVGATLKSLGMPTRSDRRSSMIFDDQLLGFLSDVASLASKVKGLIFKPFQVWFAHFRFDLTRPNAIVIEKFEDRGRKTIHASTDIVVVFGDHASSHFFLVYLDTTNSVALVFDSLTRRPDATVTQWVTVIPGVQAWVRPTPAPAPRKQKKKQAPQPQKGFVVRNQTGTPRQRAATCGPFTAWTATAIVTNFRGCRTSKTVNVGPLANVTEKEVLDFWDKAR